METLALAFLVSVAIGGIAWVLLHPMLSASRKADQRQAEIARPVAVVRASRDPQKMRRTQVEDTLKELEARHKAKSSVPLQTRIAQAGLEISKQTFLMIAAGAGIAIFLLVMALDFGLLIALPMGFAAGAGVPLWVLKYLKQKRENKFLVGFPDAVDTVVRGIKAGLPLLDSLKVIANDAPEPIRSEFKLIVQTQTIGIPIGEACGKLYERIPLPEANFFGIVIGIQQKAGGNLSEALGNLSKVLRDRKKMKAKIQAMSMEAKASAGIIGALPIAVMLLVYLSSPAYISLLWTEPLGRLMLAASAVWMFIGVMVMKKMINFDF